MNPERAAKRQRTSPYVATPKIVTPPSIETECTTYVETQLRSGKSTNTKQLLERATYILAKEAAAVANVAILYSTDPQAQQSLEDAVEEILDVQRAGGKLIICGVGKSAYIGMKTVATCKSLGIAASFLHACEAVHGDLGDIRSVDTVLFISFSGRTSELMNVLPHIPASVRIMAMSSHTSAGDCPLLNTRNDGILLPTPIPESEESTLGVSAPTLSTTVAIAVADMLALTVVDQMHGDGTKEVFQRNHPGGAIGMSQKQPETPYIPQCVPDFPFLELPSPSISGSDTG